jgi:hypothetical protein
MSLHSACEIHSLAAACCQLPRVKSGKGTQMLCATHMKLRGPGADSAAASYTSMSGGLPSRMHWIRR